MNTAINTSFRDALLDAPGARPANGTDEDWHIVIGQHSFLAFTDAVTSSVYGRRWTCEDAADVPAFVERVFKAVAAQPRMPGCLPG